MKANDIKATIANIARTKWELENALEENGGELTDELLGQLDILEDLKALLTEGVDDLGRWLKSVQDEGAALKAEADAAARKVKANKGYEDYVKGLIGQAMDALEQDKVKGSFYGFTRTTSTKSAVDTDGIEDIFMPQVQQILAGALPSWLHIKLTTTTTELREAGEDAMAFLEETTAPAIRFTKPRANATKKQEENQ